MRERHAFWRTAAAGGEEQEGLAPVADARQAEQSREQPRRRDEHGGAPRDDVVLHRRQDVVEEDGVLGPGKIAEPFHERMRGQAVLDLRLRDAALHRRGARGEVQVHRHFVREQHGEIGDERGLARWQHDGHAMPRALGAHGAAERDGRREQRAARERGVIRAVDHADIELPAPQPAQTGLAEVTAEQRALLVAKLAQLQKPLAHQRDVGLLGHDRLAERDGHGIRKPARPFEEILPSFEAEDRAPEIVRPRRDDRAFHGARDEFVAAFQPEQHAAAGEFALGKNADDFTREDRLARRAHGVLRFARADRQRADRAKDGVEQAQIVDVVKDDEADRARARELEHDGVDPREVIRQEQKSARRQPVRVMGSDAVDAARDQCADGAKEAFGKGGSGGG